MKKIKILLLLLVVSSLALIGCTKKGYINISYKELENKLSNQDTFILFIGRETCSACSVFKEVLNEHAKDHKEIEFYYIDLDSLSDEENIKLDSKFDYSGTPTSFIIEKGQIPSSYDKYTGYNSYNDIINKLKEKGIIKG